MPVFEFALEGPPVSLNAKEGTPRSRKRYRDWVNTVAAAAQASWPSDGQLVSSDRILVTVFCYHSAVPPDVDNILKPICDGMKGVVYEDDNQIWKIVSQRISLITEEIPDPNEVLSVALGKFTEIVHVIVEWDAED